MSDQSDRLKRGIPTLQSIAVSGYKSIRSEQSIEIRPLTLLAGVNSSGKSSIIQTVLLLKQTLESTYDPGPLLLDGSNAKFSRVSQLFFKSTSVAEKQFMVRLGFGDISYGLYFIQDEQSRLHLAQMEWVTKDFSFKLTPDMTTAEFAQLLANPALNLLIDFTGSIINGSLANTHFKVVRNRCFFELQVDGFVTLPFNGYVNVPRSIIHVPGLRGNPSRSYPVTAVGTMFPGTFENYTASVIDQWQNDSSGQATLEQVGKYLKDLGLTWKIRTRKVDDTKVELQVGRTLRSARGGASDMVNVADVGFGVSQTLPVLVALLAARPGQVVYLEQPEIHLHPRAQVAMAGILVEAALRGVRVVAETHSALLLTAVQTLVAKGRIDPTEVKLHWFARDEDGETHITSADVDETGAFGDWPEDFDEVILKAEGDYLNSVDARLSQQRLL